MYIAIRRKREIAKNAKTQKREVKNAKSERKNISRFRLRNFAFLSYGI